MKILVPVDFSEITNSVIKLAKKIAEVNDAEILLFHTVSPAFYIPYPESISVEIVDLKLLEDIERKTKREAEEKMKGLIEALKPVKSRYIVEVGDAREAILEVEEREDVDLVIMASHSKGLVEKVLIGSTAEKVARHSIKPILILKGKEIETPENIVVAYDFSETSEKALYFTIDIFGAFKPHITLLHIEEDIDLPIVEEVRESVLKKYSEEKKKYLGDLAQKIASKGIEVSLVIRKDKDPAESIVRYVKENERMDLLVIGSKGLSGLKRIILGSTSSDVFRKVEKPVLIYKEGKRK